MVAKLYTCISFLVRSARRSKYAPSIGIGIFNAMGRLPRHATCDRVVIRDARASDAMRARCRECVVVVVSYRIVSSS